MLEPVYGWILSDFLSADDAENPVTNTDVTHVLPVFATESYNYENDVYTFWDVETLGIYEKALSCFGNYLNSIKKSNGRYKVHLLFKKNQPAIHDNLFHSTWKTFV